MLDLIWLLPALPLAGFLILALTAGTLPKPVVAVVGAGSVGLAFVVAALASYQFLGTGQESVELALWTWMAAGDFTSGFNFYLDLYISTPPATWLRIPATANFSHT